MSSDVRRLDICGGAEDVGHSPTTFSLTVLGRAYVDARVTLARNGTPVVACSAESFHALCRKIAGKGARLWHAVASEEDITLHLDPTAWSGFEQNLMKAASLLYLWCEPNLVSQAATVDSDFLVDEIILDYTGRPGPQPFIYFPIISAVSSRDSAVGDLVENRLLCRLSWKAAEPHQRVFVPLAIPSVRPDILSREAKGLWATIQRDMAHRIQRLVDRKQ